MQGKGSTMAPEQNKRKQVYNEESDGHLIFAMSFSRFLKSLKKDLCKNQHLSPFTNSNQILTSLSEKRLRKASSSLALYSFSCTCFSSLQKEPKLVITVTPHCMGGGQVQHCVSLRPLCKTEGYKPTYCPYGISSPLTPAYQ